LTASCERLREKDNAGQRSNARFKTDAIAAAPGIQKYFK